MVTGLVLSVAVGVSGPAHQECLDLKDSLCISARSTAVYSLSACWQVYCMEVCHNVVVGSSAVVVLPCYVVEIQSNMGLAYFDKEEVDSFLLGHYAS